MEVLWLVPPLRRLNVVVLRLLLMCHLHQRCRRSTVPVSTVSHLNSLVRDVATFWCYRPPFPAVAVRSWWSCCSWVFLWCAELLCNPHVSWLLVDHELWNTELGISTTFSGAKFPVLLLGDTFWKLPLSFSNTCCWFCFYNCHNLNNDSTSSEIDIKMGILKLTRQHLARRHYSRSSFETSNFPTL